MMKFCKTGMVFMRSSPAGRTGGRAEGPVFAVQQNGRFPSNQGSASYFGKKFIAESQNAAKPHGLVLFEYLVLIATLGSLTYLVINQ